MSGATRRSLPRQAQLEMGLSDPLLGPLVNKLLAEGRYPEAMITEAYRATALRMADPERPLANPHAYFKGVLRRLTLEASPRRTDSAGDAALRRAMKERFLLGSVVADMREAGLDDVGIYHQLLSDYGESVSSEVLAEFGRMLLRKRAG